MTAEISRNIYWGRTHGWANLLEEHDLNLRVRIPREVRKYSWARRSLVEPGTARPVFVVGAQRSGTNMVTYGLDMSPEFQVFNEGNRRAFANYRLRERAHVLDLVERSRHEYVAFKPLLDSHLVLGLLDGMSTSNRARAVWIYREVRGRVRSELAKFGDSNLRVLLLRAKDPGLRHWQLNDDLGLSEESESLLDSFDPATLTQADGAALFWLIRNRLVFEQGLAGRDDVAVLSYDQLVASPGPEMRRLCDFLDFPYSPNLIRHIETRPPSRVPTSEVKPRILELCDDLHGQLDSLNS
ncbi:MAG: sulfotransferase domain-containing protein [Acidimicrobiia bacterium]